MATLNDRAVTHLHPNRDFTDKAAQHFMLAYISQLPVMIHLQESMANSTFFFCEAANWETCAREVMLP